MPENREPKLNVLPWLAAGSLLLAVAALAFAVVALGRSGEEAGGEATGNMMAAMSGEDMAHMEPLPIDGITEASATSGGSELKGVERDGALEFKLDARPVWWTIFPGQKLAAYAYNGIIPGPMIRVRDGQKVRIRFTNDLPVETTIHWHGIGVPNSEDGVPGVTQKPIAPGATYTYEFTARPAGEPDGGGTFLYHSHVDEDRQMSVGLSGAFIIEPPRPQPNYTLERTLLISEWTADPTSGRTRGVMEMEGMLPNFFTIDGKSYPATETIHVKAGKTVLLRLINAGQFAHPMHLHGTAFRIVAQDGHPVPKGGLRDTITLASGERADIAFELPPGKWILHCHIGHHLTNDGEGPGGLMEVIEAS